MAKIELIMPKMGESVAEATIISWHKEVGETIEMDETIVEIATDKVDSEVPSSLEGVLVEKLFDVDAVVKVGEPFAIIETSAEESNEPATQEKMPESPASTPEVAQKIEEEIAQVKESVQKIENKGERFYSPLVRSIASEEGLSIADLDQITGSGKDGRVTKTDLLDYLQNKGTSAPTVEAPKVPTPSPTPTPKAATSTPPKVSMSGDKEIVEMDRMRKLIADHMIMSKQTSPHVTSFVEADVTTLVNWRNRIKDDFKKREGQNITFTPIFIEAVAKAIKDFPMINVSVDGTNIVVHKDINIGMAAALPSGNLIVPVVKGADQMNLMGITKTVNDLANRARNNQLKPDEIQGGTFTLTNVGSFGNVMGTPIINQPQVAIMAVGAIKKKPAVIETPHGDLIGIRHMMFLSLSYDHRVVDGALGGSFLRKVADYLEQFDDNTSI
ncbi:MAG: dihydrolipoamide acetyltransferase family protein [Flavobacteriales bacterium]|nr:dihydrolipoamide acetyltransferase family protein [Flavobacteriales bacterium]